MYGDHESAGVDSISRIMNISGKPAPSDKRSDATADALRQLLLVVRADLAALLTDEATPAEHLGRIVRLARDLVPGTDQVSVCSLQGRTIETIATTDNTVAAVDRVQSAVGEGPFFEVTGSPSVVRVDDLQTDTRWPTYAARACAAGVGSVLVCELPMTPGLPSALTCYAMRPGAFDVTAELVAPIFASRAAIALAHAQQVAHLHRAIHSRQIIGQAVGILMERHRISADRAFERLVNVSQHRHVKLRDLAAVIAETGQDPEDIKM